MISLEPLTTPPWNISNIALKLCFLECTPFFHRQQSQDTKDRIQCRRRNWHKMTVNGTQQRTRSLDGLLIAQTSQSNSCQTRLTKYTSSSNEYANRKRYQSCSTRNSQASSNMHRLGSQEERDCFCQCTVC